MSKVTCHVEKDTKTRKDGRIELVLRFSANRRHRRVYTGIYIQKDWWAKTPKFGSWLKEAHENINKRLKGKLTDAEGITPKLEEKGIPVTLDNVANYYKNGFDKKESFLSFTQTVIDRLQEGKQVNTYKKYKTTLKKLKDYLVEKKLEGFALDEFNVTFLSDYEAYLKSKKNHVNTIEKELKVLRAVLYRAIKEDLFPQDKNPFFRFKIKSGKTKKEKLNEEEVIKIEGLKIKEGDVLWHVRNYWLFSYYCYGIRFSDVATLSWSSIRKDRLRYDMHKTGNPVDLKIFPKAEAILNHYRNLKKKKSNNNFVFPILDDQFIYDEAFFTKQKISSKNSIINVHLKTIADLAKIEKPLSFHISRHTFSDIARKKGVPVYSISKVLAHSSLKMTENYLNSLDTDTIDKDLERFSNR